MKKTAFSLAATAALTGAFATSVSADEYTVNKGDTLWGISQENNTSVDKLKELNNLDSDLILIDQQLKLSGEASAQQAETYEVKKGDTLYGIGKEHNASVDELMSWNGLSSSLIHPGDKLSVSGEAVPSEEPAEAPAEETTEEAPAEETNTEETSNDTSNDVIKEFTAEATAYTASCTGCTGVTATGIDLNKNPDQKVVAVDPDVIPLGSKVYVEGYGTAIAGDTGGAIDGNRIDLYMPNREDALDFGRQDVTIQVLAE
ncbi:3D domain-containing protein [Halobacillus sp. Marseille-Q1614]|uniref:3D domain-containing protein n=1 Tax=Halobacillus sp. Marseille-Q1614 TaxID=2709134 RepID=UPI00156FBDD0|nr:3D domain-containing protein [Halobacillus sp. Marseille-Q1614]